MFVPHDGESSALEPPILPRRRCNRLPLPALGDGRPSLSVNNYSCNHSSPRAFFLYVCRPTSSTELELVTLRHIIRFLIFSHHGECGKYFFKPEGTRALRRTTIFSSRFIHLTFLSNDYFLTSSTGPALEGLSLVLRKALLGLYLNLPK